MANTALPTPPTTPTKSITSPDKAFVVRPSTTGGMGAFATRTLYKNEILLAEMPLYTAAKTEIFAQFAKISRKKQKKIAKLHASDHFKPGTPHLEAVWDTNSFATGANRQAGLFPIAARFNHACEPNNNIHYEYDQQARRLRLWVGVDRVEAGEELRICYGRGKTPALLYQWYGFRCACGACDGLSDEEVGTFAIKW